VVRGLSQIIYSLRTNLRLDLLIFLFRKEEEKNQRRMEPGGEDKRGQAGLFPVISFVLVVFVKKN
jgi:hypothetical protein